MAARDRPAQRGGRVVNSRGAIRGLVLGKFLPPHVGHLHLIRTAAGECDELTVMVCTLEREPIPGRLRFEWMRELARDVGANVTVVHVTEDVPQAPAEHPAFWQIWKELCSRYAGSIDVVFTSEEYGDELARILGAKHHLVDLMRLTHPISGTAVRDDPLRTWEMIQPPVRAHFAVRVALVGPESVGKSTLAARLADAFDTVWVPEYGRTHTTLLAERHGVPFAEVFAPADIEAIAMVQAQWEDRAARTANRVLFCDTELLTTRIWSEMFFGSCPESVVAASEAREYDLYLLLDTDVPWVDDGTRGFRDRRDDHLNRIRELLEALGRPYETIRGTFEDRFSRAVAAVQERWPLLEARHDA